MEIANVIWSCANMLSVQTSFASRKIVEWINPIVELNLYTYLFFLTFVEVRKKLRKFEKYSMYVWTTWCNREPEIKCYCLTVEQFWVFTELILIMPLELKQLVDQGVVSRIEQLGSDERRVAARYLMDLEQVRTLISPLLKRECWNNKYCVRY